MSERARVNLVVSESKKEQWDEYADENTEYSSLSDLIRVAVAREVNDGHAGENGPETDELERQMAQVVEGMEELGSRFANVETRLRDLENKSKSDPEIENLKGDVYDVLPSEKPGTKQWRDFGEDPNTRKSWSGRTSEIADELGEPEYRVTEAIERLQEETHIVRETELKGDTRYWRRD